MIRPITLALAFVIAWLGAGIPAGAQTTVVNPRTVEFDPSADHAALTSDNQPVVQRYDLSFYLVGASQPVTTTALGKPAPGADGKIRVDFSAIVAGWPLADGTYEARVAAIGPSGAAASDPSNTFTFVQAAPVACTYALSTSTLAFTSVGGIGTVTVTAGASCAWTAAGAVSWLTLTTSGGTGTGVVSFNVDANTGSTSRTATLTIGGQSLTITQAAPVAAPAPCSYALSQSAMSFTEAGGSGTVQVTAATGCAWTASASASWVTVGGSTGDGSGVVTLTVAPSVETAVRSAAITIAGQALVITQAAAPAPCSYALPQSSMPFTGVGGTGTVQVMTASGCAWAASAGVSWVTLGSSSGVGSGSVTFTIGPSVETSARTATVTIAGLPFAITQEAGACAYKLSPTSKSFNPNGSNASISIACGTNCPWVAIPGASWVTLASSSGQGSGTLSYSVGKNPGLTSRTTTITVSGEVFTVTQAAPERPSPPKKPKVTMIIGG